MGFISSALFGNAGEAGQFQAQSAPISAPTSLQTQQDFVNQLQANNGVANQAAVYNQLQGVASGTGPNPAQAMLANSTGQNVANQAALMAGQRGAGANSGLIARQAGLQGARIQQEAAGQGAALQAQQSLGALGQLGGLANAQIGQQQAGISNLNAQQMGLQAQQIQNTQQQNQYNASIAAINTANAARLTGGLLSGLGSSVLGNGGVTAAPSMGGAGSVPDVSGSVNSNYTMPAFGSSAPGGSAGGGGTAFGLGGDSFSASEAAPAAADALAHGGKVGPRSRYGKHLAGHPVQAIVSPGERYLSPQAAKEVAEGKKSPMDSELIPGQAPVKGDSLKNDVVPKTLEAGGVVIPRSILQGKNPEIEAAKFVRAHLKKGKK